LLSQLAHSGTLQRIEIDPDQFVCPSSGSVSRLIDVVPASIEVVALREPGKLVDISGLEGPRK